MWSRDEAHLGPLWAPDRHGLPTGLGLVWLLFDAAIDLDLVLVLVLVVLVLVLVLVLAGPHPPNT